MYRISELEEALKCTYPNSVSPETQNRRMRNINALQSLICFKKYIAKIISPRKHVPTPGSFRSFLWKTITRRWSAEKFTPQSRKSLNAERKKKHRLSVRQASSQGKSNAHAAARIIAERQHLITSSGAVRPTTPKERNAARTQRSSQRKR